MANSYVTGAEVALAQLALTKTAAPWTGFMGRLRPLLARGAQSISRWSGSAAQKLEPAASKLVDQYGNPLSSTRNVRGAAEEAAAKPGLLRSAFQQRNKGYMGANAVGGYFSNEREDTPKSERFLDAGVGLGANMLISPVPFLPREASAFAGALAVPLVRGMRRD